MEYAVSIQLPKTNVQNKNHTIGFIKPALRWAYKNKNKTMMLTLEKIKLPCKIFS